MSPARTSRPFDIAEYWASAVERWCPIGPQPCHQFRPGYAAAMDETQWQADIEKFRLVNGQLVIVRGKPFRLEWVAD